MNARQKAKKYKQQIDLMNKMVYKPKTVVTNIHVDKLRYTRAFNPEEVRSIPPEVIKRIMIEGLTSSGSFKENVHIESHLDRSSQNLIVEANIGIASGWQGCL